MNIIRTAGMPDYQKFLIRPQKEYLIHAEDTRIRTLKSALTAVSKSLLKPKTYIY